MNKKASVKIRALNQMKYCNIFDALARKYSIFSTAKNIQHVAQRNPIIFPGSTSYYDKLGLKSFSSFTSSSITVHFYIILGFFIEILKRRRRGKRKLKFLSVPLVVVHCKRRQQQLIVSLKSIPLALSALS